MKVNRLGINAALLAMSLVATPALAQVCVGVPLNVGQTTVSTGAEFPDGGNIFGLRAANHFAAPLTIGASYSAMVPEADGADSRHSLGVDAAFELPITAASLGICAVAGASASLSDEPRVIQVPLGVSVGGAFEVDSGISIAPFAAPQLFWTRTSVGDFSDSESLFGLDAGANLVVSNLYFGATINKIFEDGYDALFGVQAGLVF